jgi:hypothetical protein
LLPELHIITGSTGAGKLTGEPDYLPDNIRDHCKNLILQKKYPDKNLEISACLL